MYNHEITGDWMSISAGEYNDLLKSTDALDSKIIGDIMLHPVIRKLNIEVRFPSGNDLSSMEILSTGKTGIRVRSRLFTLKGDTAILESDADLVLRGAHLNFESDYNERHLMDMDHIRNCAMQHFFIFCVIQFLMLYAPDKISFHMEHRNGLSPVYEGLRPVPYTKSREVQMLDLNAAAEEVHECILAGYRPIRKKQK